MFDGYLRAPDYRRGSNKYRTLTTGVYDWRKELEAIYITESAGGTESYVDRSIDFIFGDFEVGAGFTDHFTHPYGLVLWAKTLEDITRNGEPCETVRYDCCQ